MATLYITEYMDIDGQRQIPKEPPLAQQTVTIAAGQAQSAPFNPQTTLVRLHCDAICSVLFGIFVDSTHPAATATSGRMALGQTEYRGIVPNENMCVSVITNS